MELRHIKDLMAAMRRYKTRRLVYEEEGVKLELEQAEEGGSQVTHVHQSGVPMAMPMDVSMHGGSGLFQQTKKSAGTEEASTEKVSESVVADGNYVTSPMVGTFYAATSPEDPPFVKPGDQVTPDTVICIVEAMKVMNEVKAGISGTVEEVLVENAHPVEFGTKLFRIS